MSKLYGNALCYFLLLAFFQFSAQAQTQKNLSIATVDQKASVLSNYRYARQVNDSLEAFNTLSELISALHNDGYLLAVMKEAISTENGFEFRIEVGERFEWLALKLGNLEKGLIRRSGYRSNQFDGRPFRYKEIARVQDRLVSYAEQNGYPFAAASIDSLFIEGDKIGGVLNFDTGPPITFDSLDISSDFPISTRFLGNYLGIRLGDLYDHSRIDRVGQSLAALPYMRVAEAPKLTFQNSEATLHLKLAKRRVNQIDGIIGFLPDANNDNELLITGQFDVLLHNPFGSGKKIGLHWRRQNVESQTLNLEYEHPNLLKSPVSGRLAFDFLKQDTTFTTRDLYLELSYRVGAAGHFTVFTRQQAANRISNVGLSEVTVLPEVLDFDLSAYGLGFRWSNFDDFFLPKRGIGLSLNASVGNKRISPGSDLPTDLLTGVDLKNLQYELRWTFEKHSRLTQNLVLFNRFNGGLIFNDQLFRNDAIRLGGLNSIRGFNENFFFATRYGMATMEGRFFFDELSYFSLFTDVAAVYDGFTAVPTTDYPVGLGAGVSFSTNAGIVNFVYALGSSDQAGSLSINQSKFHFGFTSRF